MKAPLGHRLVSTEDGSYTLFSEAFQEACHSTSGATQETLLHYVEGCKVVESSQSHSPFMILEVGFGLGIGLLTTLWKMPQDRKWHFLSLELDKNLLHWFQETQKNHPLLKDLFWEKNILRLISPQVEITILQGNARKTLPQYLEQNKVKFHAIYQDAFSPKRNPVLWTKEWFLLLKNHSHKDVILSTYSASNSIRKSLHESGWGVHPGERFGQKRASTRADLKNPTDGEILFQMERSPALALTDENMRELLA